MKKISILITIGMLQFSIAGSSFIEKIEADKGCKLALSKDYRTASTRELQCKTIHALAQKLNAHPSYRDFERIKLIKKIQDKLKLMGNAEKINWVLKDREIKKNVNKLQALVWPVGELCYFDIEVNGNQISFISAINKNGTIKLKTKSEKFNSAEVGQSVEICTSDNTCTEINSNHITLKNYQYSRLRIKTPNGTMNYDFKTLKRQDLVRIAYEVYAQLYNKNLPPLSKIDVNIGKEVKTPPIEVGVDDRPKSGIVSTQ